MRLNKEELITAGILTAIVTPWKWWILTIPLCAFLWALTGSESKYNYKLWRRLGVPVVWGASLWMWQVAFAIPVAFGFLSMGYGIPSTQPFDEGSWLGRIFKNDLIVRGIIYSGATLPFILVRFLW